MSCAGVIYEKKNIICKELQKQVSIEQCDELGKECDMDKIVVCDTLFFFPLFLVRVTVGATRTTTQGGFVGVPDSEVNEYALQLPVLQMNR